MRPANSTRSRRLNCWGSPSGRSAVGAYASKWLGRRAVGPRLGQASGRKREVGNRRHSNDCSPEDDPGNSAALAALAAACPRDQSTNRSVLSVAVPIEKSIGTCADDRIQNPSRRRPDPLAKVWVTEIVAPISLCKVPRDELGDDGKRTHRGRETRTEATAGHDDDPCAKTSPLPVCSGARRAEDPLPQGCRSSQPIAAVA
jgi:hypothetical protein